MTHAPINFNDPDFDLPVAAEGGENKHSPFGQLSPKLLFIGGLVGGFLLLCTIGFFILLGLLINGK